MRERTGWVIFVVLTLSVVGGISAAIYFEAPPKAAGQLSKIAAIQARISELESLIREDVTTCAR